MSSSVAVVGAEYNNHDLVDPDGICFHTLVRGGPWETANVRGEDRLVPRLTGMVEGLFERNDRTIEFYIYVRGIGADEQGDREDFYDNALTLMGWLGPEEYRPLVITLPGGSQWSIEARPNPIPPYRMQVPSFGENSITFVAVAPDWTEEAS